MIMKQVSFKSLTILRQQQNILIPRKLVLARHETENQQVSTIFKKKTVSYESTICHQTLLHTIAVHNVVLVLINRQSGHLWVTWAIMARMFAVQTTSKYWPMDDGSSNGAVTKCGILAVQHLLPFNFLSESKKSGSEHLIFFEGRLSKSSTALDSSIWSIIWKNSNKQNI